MVLTRQLSHNITYERKFWRGVWTLTIIVKPLFFCINYSSFPENFTHHGV